MSSLKIPAYTNPQWQSPQVRGLRRGKFKINNMDTQELYDSLYNEVEEYVKPLDFIRPSQLQHKFLLGYQRANRLINTLISKGIIDKEPQLNNYRVIKNDNTSHT